MERSAAAARGFSVRPRERAASTTTLTLSAGTGRSPARGPARGRRAFIFFCAAERARRHDKARNFAARAAPANAVSSAERAALHERPTLYMIGFAQMGYFIYSQSSTRERSRQYCRFNYRAKDAGRYFGRPFVTPRHIKTASGGRRSSFPRGHRAGKMTKGKMLFAAARK